MLRDGPLRVVLKMNLAFFRLGAPGKDAANTWPDAKMLSTRSGIIKLIGPAKCCHESKATDCPA